LRTVVFRILRIKAFSSLAATAPSLLPSTSVSAYPRKPVSNASVKTLRCALGSA